MKKKRKKTIKQIIESEYSIPETNPERNTDIDRNVEVYEIFSEEDIYDKDIIEEDISPEHFPLTDERP